MLRVDVAVGPFSVVPGKNHEIEQVFCKKAPGKLKRVTEGLGKNRNPRCSLAIEVVFSGSSKHILGDITNASMMGLYGFVVTSEDMLKMAQRVYEYIKTVKELEKAGDDLFNNVCILSAQEFLSLLS